MLVLLSNYIGENPTENSTMESSAQQSTRCPVETSTLLFVHLQSRAYFAKTTANMPNMTNRTAEKCDTKALRKCL